MSIDRRNRVAEILQVCASNDKLTCIEAAATLGYSEYDADEATLCYLNSGVKGDSLNLRELYALAESMVRNNEI